MSRRLQGNLSGRLRRFGTVLALLALVFASTVASVSHSIAMPLMADTVDQTAGPSGHHMEKAAHDCESDARAEAPQPQPRGPCDAGCLLCKNCTMTTFTLISPADIDAVGRYDDYEAAAIRALAGITPPSPNEPPRL